ncbi:ABC transporter ATPase [Pseudopedobacter sp.]|uniref:ABC transporter ATPase n=1 Tax=Pseudopedobacter sp. TaxID=1936787 RepID=UPI00333F1194
MELSLESKVWIYQSNRIFTSAELERLNTILADFTTSWTAHNQQLKASYEIKYQRFIVLIVDETLTGASGCSIDKSVHVMKAIEEEFKVNLFDRFQVAWKEGNEIKITGRSEFESLIQEQKVNAETIVFNNLVKNLSELNHAWEVPLKESWHAKVFL